MRRLEATALLLLWVLLALPAATAVAVDDDGADVDADVDAGVRAAKGKPAKRDPARAGGGGANAAAAADEELPTEEEIRRAFDDADYKSALQMLSRVVNLRGTAGAAYDKHAMWMLKGESHLRLKQLKPAGEAFANAARETDDESLAATARAMERLLAVSKTFRITRRHAAGGAGAGAAKKARDDDDDDDKGKDPKPKSADLLDPAQRQTALTILYEDELAALRPKLKAALRVRTLPPIAEALKLADGLHDLEVAATGGDSDLSQLRGDLAERAVTLMTKALDRIAKDVADIKEDAEELVERRLRRERSFGGGYGGSTEVITTNRRGLLDGDVKKLKDAMATCRQIIEAAESLAKSGGGDAGDATDLVDRAADVGEAADRVLNGEYGPPEDRD